ncbi:MAG: hypothetical protein JNK42_02515 [Caedimonas sp.]|nr:hypothetical protein [Caedimonas sp.]
MEKDFPEYLSEILRPTPSGTAKLLAAWERLSYENQIKILLNLSDPYPDYLREKICRHALNSENAYIRYLAVKKAHYDEEKTEDQELIKKVEDDASPLVKYCLDESFILRSPFTNPDVFFSLPHDMRLAKVRNLSGSGSEIAKLFSNINTYINENKISEIEALEILVDYTDSPGFKSYKEPYDKLLGDDYLEFCKGYDIERLWKLTLKIPKSLSYPLLETLPNPNSWNSFSEASLEEILDKLDNHQLATVLYRDDIGLCEYRKKVFFRSEDSTLRSAALYRYFDLTHKEFASLLPNLKAMDKVEDDWNFKDKNDKKKLEILSDLGFMARDLSWVYFQAIHDLLSALPSSFYSQSERKKWPRHRLKQLLEEGKKNKDSYHIQSQALDLKLYDLAVRAEPWTNDKDKDKPYSPNGELDFLHGAIIEGNTWGTFMAFSEKWKQEWMRHKSLKKFLPPLYDFDDDEKTEKDQIDNSPSNLTHKYDIEEIEKIAALLKSAIVPFFYTYAITIVLLVLWLVFR